MATTIFKAAKRISLTERLAKIGITATDLAVMNNGESIEIKTGAALTIGEQNKIIALLNRMYRKDFEVVV